MTTGVPMSQTLIAIDRDSDEPLYKQVRWAIERAITTGIFDPGRRLPSSRELATELAVSRNTVNLAYQELIAVGYVYSQERQGLFVNPELRPAKTVPPPRTAVGIDWPARMRAFGDAGVPHIEKRADWHR